MSGSSVMDGGDVACEIGLRAEHVLRHGRLHVIGEFPSHMLSFRISPLFPVLDEDTSRPASSSSTKLSDFSWCLLIFVECQQFPQQAQHLVLRKASMLTGDARLGVALQRLIRFCSMCTKFLHPFPASTGCYPDLIQNLPAMMAIPQIRAAAKLFCLPRCRSDGVTAGA